MVNCYVSLTKLNISPLFHILKGNGPYNPKKIFNYSEESINTPLLVLKNLLYIYPLNIFSLPPSSPPNTNLR